MKIAGTLIVPIVNSFQNNVVFASVALMIAVACAVPLRSVTLINAYITADCLTPVFAPGVHPPTRGWNTTIPIAGGAKATITGATLVGRDVEVRYESDGSEKTVVKYKDYIYASDVRLNDARDRLYVKTSGSAAGIWHETWLYEYDLQKKKQLRKSRVEPAVLPPECELQK